MFVGGWKPAFASAARCRKSNKSSDVEEHAKVLDAIVERDPEAARIAIRTIIGDVLVLIEERQPLGE